MAALTCQRCGRPLEILRQPTRRLKDTGFRWRGFLSLFGEALRSCPGCGAVYTGAGELLAAAIVETATEASLKAYRNDMWHLRDAFAAVVLAAELGVAWMWFGSQSFGLFATVLTGVVGLAAVPPFVFFAQRARQASRDLAALKAARLAGEPGQLTPLVPSDTVPGR